MKKQVKRTGPVVEREPLKRLPGYLTAREAAQVIGVSQRSVYGYVEAGKLSGVRLGNMMVVLSEEVERFERKAPGRTRTGPPRWHQPPEMNREYLTMIEVRLRPGQAEALKEKVERMRVEKKHLLPGTVARYMGHNHDDPTLVVLIDVLFRPYPRDRAYRFFAQADRYRSALS